MARYKNDKAGNKIPLTAAEETEADAWEVAFSENEPARDRAKVIEEIAQTDGDMARVVDDLVAFVVDGTPMPQAAKDKVAVRKVLRENL